MEFPCYITKLSYSIRTHDWVIGIQYWIYFKYNVEFIFWGCEFAICYYDKMLCCIGQIQWAPVRAHLPVTTRHGNFHKIPCGNHISGIHGSGVPCSMQKQHLGHSIVLQRSCRAMIRWLCDVATKDQVSSQELLQRMQLDDLEKGTPHSATRHSIPQHSAVSNRDPHIRMKTWVVDWTHPYIRD